jgi:transcriptional regulator with XRE-family HTH domain
MKGNLKLEFGRRFRDARDRLGFSRASLGLRLGISPKTIQSWEMGRTFIEDLSLIPALEAELDISISAIIAEAVGALGGTAPGSPRARKTEAKAGPILPTFQLHSARAGSSPSPEALAEAFVAVPIVKTTSAAKPVAGLAPRDIAGHVIIPSEWVPRGGVMVAFRVSDSGLAPMIPLGSTVIVDRRPYEPDKMAHRVLAFWLQNKGMRLRRLERHPESGKLLGMPSSETQRGMVVYRPAQGDTILGRVVGVLAPVE